MHAAHMSANHSDCRYAIRGDRVPFTGTRYTTFQLVCDTVLPQNPRYYRGNGDDFRGIFAVVGLRFTGLGLPQKCG